ncbi:hypothetical protein ACFY05_32950 [Microtetraspora fusca]|uniref:Uncharacterized protein n=1 Tax=Microtetraspora fusca TaxID=1997 RepID=A0ABW6VGD3_MICFU
MPSKDPRASLEAATTAAVDLGYTVREADHTDIDGTVMLDCSGHGELIEVHFKANPDSGYLRFAHGFIHYDRSGDRLGTWKGTLAMLQSCARQEI